jgi:4'-phosphopantetheinyl transferase
MLTSIRDSVSIVPVEFSRPAEKYQSFLALTDVSDGARHIAMASEFLNPEELSLVCVQRPFTKRYLSFAAGRICAKSALMRSSGIADPRAITITRGVFDFPIVKTKLITTQQISISHTSVVAAAISFDEGHPVGIDIEAVGTGILEFGDEVFTPAEQALVAQTPLLPNHFLTALWSIKESLSKILRTGLMTPFALFEVTSNITVSASQVDVEFKNFPQYRATAFIMESFVFAITYPRKSQMNLDGTLLDQIILAKTTPHEVSTAATDDCILL